MSEHIILAYGFDGNGGGIALDNEEVSEQIKDDKLAWVHLDANHPETRNWIKSEIDYLDQFIIDALLVDETRPRMTRIKDGVLLILRGVNLNENDAPEDMISIRLWVDKKRIISIQRRKLKAVRDIEARINDGSGPKDAGQFICMLVARLFERMEPVLSSLDDATDDIEERILEHADGLLRTSIIDIRKKAIKFRRYMAPQREAVSQLRMVELEWLNSEHKRYLQESFNHVTRYVEDLDAIRERSQIVKDELANILTDKLNNNMYVLSVIAAIFLPLGFLTGLVGVNLGGIPGSDNPIAFWLFSGFLFILVIAQIYIFKRLKWF